MVGDDDGFEEAFDALYPKALLLASRICSDRAAAEDVAAEALARTLARWNRVRTLPYRDAWVMKVATNLAVDHAARKQPILDRPTATDEEEVAVIRVALAAALRALPRRQREVVALRYLSDLSEADVAAALRISPGSVKT